MSVEISNLTKKKVNTKKLEKIISLVLKDLKLKDQLSLVLIGKRRMQILNYTWRKKNKPTDVLTFVSPDFNDKNKKIVEIFINLDDCQKTKKYQDFFDHTPAKDDVLHWLLIHGLLHGAGYDDKNTKERDEIVEEGKLIFKKLKKRL